MLALNKAYNKKPGLISRASLNFQSIWVVPQFLGGKEVDTVFLQISSAFSFVIFELTHEYKIYLFYSTSKVQRTSGGNTANG